MVDTSLPEELAGSAPALNGGGTVAYCGALAAAFSSKVDNLTVDKARYAQVEDKMRVELEWLEGVRAQLVMLVGEDAEAFASLTAVYKTSSSTPEERRAKVAAHAVGVRVRVRSASRDHAVVRWGNASQRLHGAIRKSYGCL